MRAWVDGWGKTKAKPKMDHRSYNSGLGNNGHGDVAAASNGQMIGMFFDRLNIAAALGRRGK